LNPLDLAGCVPSIRQWKLASLPTYLSAGQVQKVLDGCDRTTALGRRDSAAMELLEAGVDSSVITLWFGHESIETRQTYLHAHLALKEAALAKLKPYQRRKPTRFQPSDRLLAFLEAL
jgi:site-specific recombinase XerD